MTDALLTYQQKQCNDLGVLCTNIRTLKESGHKIVLTSGTFDILHVGHGRYLSLAASLGNTLVVGLDSDEKVRARKGPNRPVVREDERAEMLTYLGAVDWLYIKPLTDAKWALIKAVCPDILVISKRADYSEAEIKELEEWCGVVHVLESQAETSTTGRIRSLIISSIAPLLGHFDELEGLIGRMKAILDEIGRGGS